MQAALTRFLEIGDDVSRHCRVLYVFLVCRPRLLPASLSTEIVFLVWILQSFARGALTVFVINPSDGSMVPARLHIQLLDDTLVCVMERIPATQRYLMFMSDSGRIVGYCRETAAALNVSDHGCGLCSV